MSKSLESKIQVLEKKQSQECSSKMLMIKGFLWDRNPEICRNIEQPRVPDSWCAWMSSKIECWDHTNFAPDSWCAWMSSKIECWDHTNFALLPCSECQHFYVRCDGYVHLKIDVQDIIASLLEN